MFVARRWDSLSGVSFVISMIAGKWQRVPSWLDAHGVMPRGCYQVHVQGLMNWILVLHCSQGVPTGKAV